MLEQSPSPETAVRSRRPMTRRGFLPVSAGVLSGVVSAARGSPREGERKLPDPVEGPLRPRDGVDELTTASARWLAGAIRHRRVSSEEAERAVRMAVASLAAARAVEEHLVG